jgi:single-strand DNA-binding protein
MPAFATISGRLGIDPELRHTNGGTPVVNLSIANNRSVRTGEDRESVADWFRVSVFGRDAEIISQYARKGSALVFNGRLQNEKWLDREGVERTSTILVASNFEFLLSKRKEDIPENEADTTKAGFPGPEEEEDEQIPF